METERFYELSIQALNRAGVDTHRFPPEYVKAALDTCKGKIKVLGELPAYAGFYFKDDFTLDPAAVQKDFTAENKPRLQKLREALSRLPAFDAANLEITLKSVAAELGVKVGVLVHPTRLATTAAAAGPSLYHLMEILGKERTLARIDRALALPGW
jgi:glutamyl/glutaminyl-tRNA synthetase